MAADVTAECLNIIMKIDGPLGSQSDRDLEQVALIGALISEAIAATQPQNVFEALGFLKKRNEQSAVGAIKNETSTD
jgi:hypothetical protein